MRIGNKFIFVLLSFYKIQIANILSSLPFLADKYHMGGLRELSYGEEVSLVLLYNNKME